MKVVKCVHESWSVPLTKGKIYEVIHFQTEWIRIINDHGQEFYYLKDTENGEYALHKSNFITLREYNLNKLI
jgi:hypothetical protein